MIRTSDQVRRARSARRDLCQCIASLGLQTTRRETNMSGSIAALFQRLTQGVYVVGVAHGRVRNAFTAAWVMQVSYDPLLLALSINPNHSSYSLLKEGRSFSVNVLKMGQL